MCQIAKFKEQSTDNSFSNQTKRTWVDCNITHKQTGEVPISDSPEHLENLIRFDYMFNSLASRGINKLLGMASKKAPEAFIKYVEVNLSPIPSWEGIPDHKRQAMFKRRVRHIEQELRKPSSSRAARSNLTYSHRG